MQNDDFFNGVPVPKGETRFDDSKILDVIGIFDKYNDLYQQIKMNDINNDDSIDELFMVSMLFRWIDSSITDDDYINRTKKMISDFRQSKNYMEHDNKVLAQKIVEPYLDLMSYFRNLSLRTVEKRKGFKYDDLETLSVIMLASLSNTIESMLERNPIYESKLRKTVLKSYVQDRISEHLKDAALSIGRDLKKSAYAETLYLKGAIEEYDKSLTNTNKTPHFEDVKEFNDRLRKNNKQTSRYMYFDVSNFIYNEYKTFSKNKIDFNNLSNELKVRAKENIEAFNIENGLDTDKRAKNDLNMKWYDSIFIEGKPLISYIPNKYIRNEDTLNIYANKVIFDALLKPSTIIDKVIMANVGGTIITKVQPFNPEYRITDDTYRKTYSWFRRFLDKLHIYRIPSKMDAVNARNDRENRTYTNRCDKINNYLNRKFIEPSGFTPAINSNGLDTLKENSILKIKDSIIENDYEMDIANHIKSFGKMKKEFDEKIAVLNETKVSLENSLNKDLNNVNNAEDLDESVDNPADISNEIFEGLDIDTTDRNLNK